MCLKDMSAVKLILLLFVTLNGTFTYEDVSSGEGQVEYRNNVDSAEQHNVKATENRLAAQILAVLEHFKQPDPLGLPGVPIPDPMSVPDIKKMLPIGTLNMMEVNAYGLSKFRIANIKADLKAMKVDAGIELDEMIVRGKYHLIAFFSNARGPFTVNLKRVLARGVATLEVDVNGHLLSEHIHMDITFGDMAINFQNLGLLGSVFQGFINSAPNLVFDAMKPLMLQETQKEMRNEINKNVQKLIGDRLLPNSITPLDMAIAEGRKKVRAMGYDPYRLPNYNRTMGVISAQMTNTWISGISNFYRVGNISVAMEKNTVQLQLQIATQQITGAGDWEISFGLISRVGHIQFTVQHVRVHVNVSQALDTRERPQINDLQIDLGNIQVRGDGAGTLDYLFEFGVNVLPNLLRYQIMDALENPIKQRIQEKFNTIDVEQAIKSNVNKFSSMGKDFSFDFKFE